MAKDQQINFAGHFALGEKATESQRQTVVDSLQKEGDLAIVVNDIGFRKRMWYYSLFGEAQLTLRCSRPSCSMSRSKIASAMEIDKEAYEVGRGQILEHYGTNLFEDLKAEDKSYERLVKGTIVPDLINRRLNEYGVQIPQNRIYLETELRNLAAMRLKSKRANGSKSWVPQLDKLELRDRLRSKDTSSPICGAIMLSLYERVSDSGYSHVLQYYPQNDMKAIENARTLCTLLHKHFPEDKRWSLTFENKYFS